MRRALAPLAQLAEETGAAILAVRHLTKGEHRKAIHAGGGTVGIIGQARVGLLLAKDPDDENARVLAVSKCNVALPASSLRFSLVEVAASTEVREWRAARVEWRGKAELSADELVSEEPPSTRAIEEAKDFITSQLALGPVPSNVIHAEARKSGIAPATLSRAKKSLRIHAERRERLQARGVDLQEWDPKDRWFWLLPEPLTAAGKASGGEPE
jgi:hypothetical protein